MNQWCCGVGGWFSVNTFKIKDTSMGPNFSNCVPTMALYWKQKSTQVNSFKIHSLLGKQEQWFFIEWSLFLVRIIIYLLITGIIPLPLTKLMSLQRTYITGTLRSHIVYIKYIPVNVMKKKLKKGEMIWKSLTDISVIK